MQRDLDRLLRDARGALGEPGRDREERAVRQALEAWRVRPTWRVSLVAAAAALALVVALGAVAADVVPTRAPSSAAQTAPATIVVDRTFSCMPARSYEEPGMRTIGLAVTRRTRSTLPWKDWTPASIVLATSPVSARAKLVIVRGHDDASALRLPGLDGPGRGGVYVNTRSCVSSNARVPLSRAGVPGPPIRYETGTGCTAPGRVLVRVRARLTAATRWREIDHVFAGAQRGVREMQVAVRAQRGNAPLLYATANASSVTLWRADWPRCR